MFYFSTRVYRLRDHKVILLVFSLRYFAPPPPTHRFVPNTITKVNFQAGAPDFA